MFKFLKFITEYKDYFIFLILIIISLSLISVNSSKQIGGFRSIIIASFGKLQNAFAWIPNPILLQNENKTLVDLNIQLFKEVTAMRKALSENEILRNMLKLKNISQFNLIPCEVVYKSSIQMRNLVTVNKGLDAGINVGMSVISVSGLAGIVIGVNKNYSMVELLNNRNIKIPATLSESKCEGVVYWQEDNFLYLHYVPKSETIKVGEIVTTSLFSNKYPENIIIGKVIKIEDEQGSHFHKIYIEPATKFFNFAHLFVIDYIKNSEENQLIQEVEERIIKLRGGK